MVNWQKNMEKLLKRDEKFFGKVYSYHQIKRLMDIVMILAAAPFILFVVLLVSLLILITMGRPVFYCHERIGKGGRKFILWKFRTMVKDADKKLQDYLEEHPGMREEWVLNFKLKDDPRITPLGQNLRRLSIDEIPQFWNTLKGDMSLVGPRPIVRDELDRYGDYKQAYLSVLPGITGIWQVSGRSDITYVDRVKMDIEYFENMSFGLDIKLLIKTVFEVIRRSGAY
jgi:undecaprenyl-phosphate galactose phosphotransferase